MLQRATGQGELAPEDLRTLVGDLQALAVRALRRMYLAEEGLFVYRIRRGAAGEVLEGVSRRYTAITLIGLTAAGGEACAEVLGDTDPRTVGRNLLTDIHSEENLGDVALTLWAARALRMEEAEAALDRVRALCPCEEAHPTVELAWALTALAVDAGSSGCDDGLAHGIARRLLSSYAPESGMFPHLPAGGGRSFLRGHVTCFADLVYPIQALAHYHARTGERESIAAARRCAERLCRLQGPAGQWWWHYDVRTGRVVERYPVYSVHQDAMAPMALFDLQECGGGEYGAAIHRGLRWLYNPPEVPDSLIDPAAGVIWRKVGRREPRKLSRGMQALASRAHPALRVPGLDTLFRPRFVDYECRPYHLGWLLYAWSGRGSEARE